MIESVAMGWHCKCFDATTAAQQILDGRMMASVVIGYTVIRDELDC